MTDPLIWLYLSGGVVEDSLLGVVIDVELRVLDGEPDQDVVGAVNVGVLHVPPALHVLQQYSVMPAFYQ